MPDLKHRRTAALALNAGLLLAAGAVLLQAAAAPTTVLAAPLSETEARDIATEAYIYAYPLVTMELTRRVMTNAAIPDGNHAPMGQFAAMRTYPSATFRELTAPNADTLYEVAWLDLAKEPWILSTPDMKGRFFLMPVLDAWTEVIKDPGTRTTGTGPQTYAITGPGFKGALPQGATEIKSPTNMVWLLGRIYSTGTPEDYAEVHALQDKMALVPLSAHGKSYSAPVAKTDPRVDMKTPVRDQVERMPLPAYFKLLAQLMTKNPPAAADAPMLQRMAKIGVAPGKDFDPAKTAVLGSSIDAVPKAAQAQIMAHEKIAGRHDNGWNVLTKTGTYGTDYLLRALVSAISLGADFPEDAVHPVSTAQADAQPYDGARKYVLHFDKGQMPPVRGFWSLTMYDAEYFFAANPLDRYSVGSRSQLTPNPDGSVDLFIQKDSPGKDKDPNWLPAPAGKFILMLRLYWPSDTSPSILDGSWKPPPVNRAGG
jgi:hypothetical protein